MAINRERLARVQALMEHQGVDALLVLTHDDYLYFFDDDRFQPRAIIPREGQPIIIAFRAEAPDVREKYAGADVRLFVNVGQQMKEVVSVMKALPVKDGDKLVVGAQIAWFEVPFVLMNLFQKLNQNVRVVDIGAVMDEARLVKDEGELSRMRRAAEIAGIGMRAAFAAIRDGVAGGITENEVGAEAEYAMRKAGGGGVATPVYVNSGERSLWLHGYASERRIGRGDLVVVDLVPSYRGYLSNLCRTAVVGAASPEQRRLHAAYLAIREAAAAALKVGNSMIQVDKAGQAAAAAHGFGDEYVMGISHGIGLRFEETPAPTIHPGDGPFKLRPGMTVTVGHSVLAVPGIGGVRVEDTGLLTDTGWQAFSTFPTELAEL
jgi:Xaa-Pro dipeptidase